MKIPTIPTLATILLISISGTSLKAMPTAKLEYATLQINQAELLTLLEKVLEHKSIEKTIKCVKIYNLDKQLVYECHDKNDQRLKILLRQSDLLMQTNSTAYYLLNDRG